MGDDTLLEWLCRFEWFDPSHATLIHYSHQHATIQQQYATIQIFIHQPPRDKIFLYCRGIVGELTEDGRIVTKDTVYRTINTFKKHQHSSIAFFHNGVFGNIDRFTDIPPPPNVEMLVWLAQEIMSHARDQMDESSPLEPTTLRKRNKQVSNRVEY